MKSKKIKTFLLLSFIYISLFSIIIFIIFNNYSKLTKEKITFQETEVIKSLQKIVDFNFNSVYQDVNFIKKELESLIENNNEEYQLEEEILSIMYNFSSSKKSYSQLTYLDSTGQEKFKVNFFDTIPTIIPKIELVNKNTQEYFQKANQLQNFEIYTSKVSKQEEKINGENIQVLRFGTPIYDKTNIKSGIIILTYKFSELIEIFNQFSIENEGKLVLINTESEILISDNGKNSWFPISNDSSKIFFKDSFPEEWKNIEYKVRGNYSSEKGLFIFNTLNFSCDNTLKINFSETDNKWKIISFIDTENLNSIIKSNIIIWLYLLLITSVIVFILLYLLARSIQMQKANYEEIMNMNKLLKNKSAEIEIQRDGLFESNKLISLQKDTLQTQSVELQAANKRLNQKQLKYQESLQYAERIQAALLPTDEFLSTIFTEYFIIYKPKAIVSGDFFWADKFTNNGKELIVFAAADCTGHGIPGAFVSILGMSLLNEILYRNKYSSPNQALDEMRKQIKYMLKQKSVYSGQEDSIDMALCFLDKKEMLLQYSGANRPIIIIDKNKKIKILEPTDNPVGIYLKETKFQNIEIKIEKGDKLYLYSDGMTDQFNIRQEKYKENRLKQLIIQLYDLPMNKQKTEFLTDFENWQSTFIQIDDVLLMGVKL